MLPSAISTTLVACLLALGRATPVARNNDGPSPKPISWTSPSGERLCWQPCKEHPSAGQTLVVAACHPTSPLQHFIFNSGPTSIRLKDTDLCVEFGPGLGRNGTPLRLQKCRVNGAPGQRLFITEDRHVSLLNGPGQCADVRDGRIVDGKGELQSWRCVADNTNQIFSFEVIPPPPPPPPVPGTLTADDIDRTLCLQAESGFTNGTGTIGLGICSAVPTDLELFYVTLEREPTTPVDPVGAGVRLIDTSTGINYCIDFGEATYRQIGLPVFYAPCDPTRPGAQRLYVLKPAPRSTPEVISVWNEVTDLALSISEDPSVASGYVVQTDDRAWTFTFSGEQRILSEEA